jgi:hypothetical protein
MPVGLNQRDTTDPYTQRLAMEAFLPGAPTPPPYTQTPPPPIYGANSRPSYDSSGMAASSASAGVVQSVGDWLSSWKKGGRRTKRRKNKKRKTAKRSRKAKRGKSKRR